MTLGRIAAALFLVLGCIAPITGQLRPEEQAGKEIFRTGKSPSGGTIAARVAGEDAPVSAAILPCAGCHGFDGLGRAEGGVTPPEITWEALAHRRRPPYDQQTLKRAVTLGIDPKGNAIGSVMPRYQMSLSDMASLLKYLRILGTEIEPGVGDSEVRIGVLLPPGERLSEMRAAIRETLEAFAADTNQKGGLFGRRIVLVLQESEERGEQRAAGIASFVDQQNLFALISSFLNGAEQRIAALIAERQIPLIGALSLYTQTSREPNRYVFYLLAGLAEQGRALAIAASRRLNGSPNLAIISSAGELPDMSADSIEDQCKRLGWQAPERIRSSSPAAIAPALRDRRLDGVFVLDPGLLRGLLAVDSQLPSKPLYLVPASLAEMDPSDIPAEARERVLFSFPALPSDNTPAGWSLFQKLMPDAAASSRNVAARWAALSSASLLVSALKSSGRNLTRERVIAALETMHRFDTGLLPPATFGPNRRVASIGAHVSSAANPAESVWIEPR